MSDITLERYHGATFRLPIYLKDNENEPSDITGCILTFLLKTDSDDLTEDSDGVTLTRDDENGNLVIVVDAETMAEFTSPISAYMFDVWITWTTGLEHPLVVGKLRIKETAHAG